MSYSLRATRIMVIGVTGFAIASAVLAISAWVPIAMGIIALGLVDVYSRLVDTHQTEWTYVCTYACMNACIHTYIKSTCVPRAWLMPFPPVMEVLTLDMLPVYLRDVRTHDWMYVCEYAYLHTYIHTYMSVCVLWVGRGFNPQWWGLFALDQLPIYGGCTSVRMHAYVHTYISACEFWVRLR